jgi:hypothetical protein
MSVRIEIIDRITGANGDLLIVGKMLADQSYSSTDFALDEYITKRAAQAIISVTTGFKEDFIALTNKTINWQSDIPDGQTQTYADLLGNNIPKPFVYTGSSSSIDKTDFTCHIELNLDSTIDTVTLDWGFSSDGIIQW